MENMGEEKKKEIIKKKEKQKGFVGSVSHMAIEYATTVCSLYKWIG